MNGSVCVMRRAAVGLAVTLCVMLAAAGVTLSASAVTYADAGGSSFTALPPQRLLDTRETGGRLDRESSLQLQVTGKAGVPAGATAVAVNVTAVNTDAAGYLTVWPTGQRQPTASIVNYNGSGAVVAAMVFAPLSTGGAFDVFSSAGADIVVDVFGYMSPATPGDPAGRFVGVPHQRLFDSRGARRPGAFLFPELTAGSVSPVNITDANHGVPADATAVVVNVTAVAPSQIGHLTLWASPYRSWPGTQPPTSNLNIDTPGQTVTNMAVVPRDRGPLALYTHGSAHVVVDLIGYFTGPQSPPVDGGLFHSVSPTRVSDTRQTSRTPPGAGSVVTVDTTAAGVPADAGAVSFTLTVTEARGPGHATVYPHNTVRPWASTLNPAGLGHTVANSTIVGPLTDGKVNVFQHAGGHVVADVNGWFSVP